VKLELSYSKGKAKVTVPQKRGKSVVFVLTMEQGEALRDALRFNAVWVGDGYQNYPWPEETKKKSHA
jgi:hypothetical protein